MWDHATQFKPLHVRVKQVMPPKLPYHGKMIPAFYFSLTVYMPCCYNIFAGSNCVCRYGNVCKKHEARRAFHSVKLNPVFALIEGGKACDFVSLTWRR